MLCLKCKVAECVAIVSLKESVVILATWAMSEFRIHHDVNELLSLLYVRGGDGAEGYIDLLQKHRTPYVTTTVSAHSAKVDHDTYNLRRVLRFNDRGLEVVQKWIMQIILKQLDSKNQTEMCFKFWYIYYLMYI